MDKSVYALFVKNGKEPYEVGEYVDLVSKGKARSKAEGVTIYLKVKHIDPYDLKNSWITLSKYSG